MTTAARVEASSPPYGPWAAAWAGLAVLGVLNGIGRGLYQGRIGEQRAHQVSTGTLVAAIVPYTLLVDRRWPMPTARAAAGTGLAWVAITTAFEFGFGSWVAKQSWRTLLADYDLRRGRLWPVVLAATGAAPAAARAVRLRRPPGGADARRGRRSGGLRPTGYAASLLGSVSQPPAPPRRLPGRRGPVSPEDPGGRGAGGPGDGRIGPTGPTA